MKPFTFAIASIIDSHTGFGLPHETRIDYERIDREARRYRASRFINGLIRLRSFFNLLSHHLRKRRALNRSLRELGALNDRMLDDIGFTRGDILAAQSGRIDRQDLERRRVENRGTQRIQFHKTVTTGKNTSPREAFNEAVFARAKCA